MIYVWFVLLFMNVASLSLTLWLADADWISYANVFGSVVFGFFLRDAARNDVTREEATKALDNMISSYELIAHAHAQGKNVSLATEQEAHDRYNECVRLMRVKQ